VTSPAPERARLRTLKLAVLAAALLLVLRVGWIQIVRHDELSEKAKRLWFSMGRVPAERGDMLDRHGRPLALSVLKWNLGVAPSQIIPGQRAAMCEALGEVLGCSARDVDRRIAAAGDHHVVLGRGVVLDRKHKLTLRRCRAVTMDTMQTRVYPTDGVGASLLGFWRQDGDTSFATGLEHGLDDVLAGRSGRFRTVETGQSARDLGRIIIEEPVHGHSVGLTVDLDLQAIAERRLAETVSETRADGGSVLILDPHSGDILAAASWPLVGTRSRPQRDNAVWTNRNFVWVYEPGSVFKIFTTASLLRRAAIDTATVFDCSNPQFDGYRIHNDKDHEYGLLPLMRAFTKSSNIYFARAILNLAPQEFYRDILDFGFGQVPALPYGGQSAGIVHEPSTWSRRSLSTLAIGQEIAVTPLQLGLAVSAVANGGVLFAPRLVAEVRDHDGRLLESRAPTALRRVMAPPLAAVLREAMARVVREGTGVASRLDWITTGGKTGTAQKNTDGTTYGAHVATFAGIAPIDDPRLVIVAIVDHPRKALAYYAAESAVPLYRSIIEDIRRATDWLTDVPGGRLNEIVTAAPADLVTVPDVLQLSVASAAQRLAAAGLVVAGAEREGLVAAQVPVAGSRCRPGEPVRLEVAAAAATGARSVCPDFRGLSNREVRGLAARLGVDVALVGAGYAVRQDPPPGRELGSRPVTVRMEGTWR